MIYEQNELKDIIIDTLQSDNAAEAVKKMTEKIGKLFDVDRVHLRFYDKKTGIFLNTVAEYRRNETISSSIYKTIFPSYFDSFLKAHLTEEKPCFIIKNKMISKLPKKIKEIFEKNLKLHNEILIPVFYKNELEAAIFIANTTTKEEISEKNLDVLIPITKEIAAGTHLFKNKAHLEQTLDYEKILCKIILETAKYEEPELIFKYLLDKLANAYSVSKVMHLIPDFEGNLTIINETLEDNDKNKKILFKNKFLNELSGYKEDGITIINSVDLIKNTTLKNHLKKNNIKSFMLHPIKKTFLQKNHIKEVKEKIMICSDIERKWTKQDIDSLKLILGTIAIIYVDIKRRKEVKENAETFISALVHDLKSPIFAEQKALEFLTEKDPNDTLQSIIPYLNEIYRTNEDLLNIISNLLAVSSMEIGEYKTKKESENITEIINDATRSIKPLTDYHNSKIIQNIESNLPNILVDKDEIRRVVINIISNAIKHNADGIKIKISAKTQKNNILVSINDTGSGISEEIQSKIFSRYQTSKRRVGTGLGLYLSKQIIEYHKGKIWFKSSNKGTTFYFTLPFEQK